MARLSFFATACAAVVFTCFSACAQTAASSAKSSPALAVTTGKTSGAASADVAKPSPSAPKITYTDVNVDGPYIAMTFDDGPSAANTPKLLDLLAKKHIKVIAM